MREQQKFWFLGALLLSLVLPSFGSAAETGAAEKPPVLSSFPIQFYGYIRLDMAYDNSRMYPGNYALYVKPEGSNKNDNQISITANQTRLGFNFMGPDFEGGKTSGKVEFDFYGMYGTAPENKPVPMLRHAYFESFWPDMDCSILAGQTWDLVSPLYPDTVNFLVCANAGDIGYRRPQVRLTKGFGVGENSKITAKVNMARSTGDVSAVSGVDTGLDAGIPTFQGSVAYTAPLFTKAPAMLGLSGHWGREEYDIEATGGHLNLDTWSVSADVQLPLTDMLAVKANAWRGLHLDTYLSLVGVNAAKTESIYSRGAWTSLQIGPFDKTRFNVGYSIETPQYDQLANAGILQNSCVFANVMCNVMPAIQTALEASYWLTMYKESENADNVRLQYAMTYSF